MTSHTQSRELAGLFGRLPTEILEQVLCSLLNIDIKNLRQTCRYLKNATHLPFDRVFLSPNPRDIEVFRAVADHKVFRFDVTEIIYDDARFHEMRDTEDDEWLYNEEDDDIGDVTGVPCVYRHAYRENRSITESYGDREKKHSRHLEVQEAFKAPCSPAESYKHFQMLLQQQAEVIATNGDADALKYGLLRFPNLRRVTLTPATHGMPGQPLYLTPTIRSLPRGLIYPLHRGWPVTKFQEDHPEAEFWSQEEKKKWRGFCLISRVIAQHLRDNPTYSLPELSVDSHQLWTGMNCRIFDEADNSEYKDLVTILSQSGFARLDLSLHCSGQRHEEWWSFRSGHLRNALKNAVDMQHINLYTNIPVLNTPWWYEEEGGEEHFIPLRTIFPIDTWSNLRHFALSRFWVKEGDITEFLGALPTLESVELSFLIFLPDSGDYRGLLEDMREKLGWRERAAMSRPKLVVRINCDCGPDYEMISVSREVMDFVYGDGANPFLDEPLIMSGIGTLVDPFDPMYERPNV